MMVSLESILESTNTHLETTRRGDLFVTELVDDSLVWPAKVVHRNRAHGESESTKTFYVPLMGEAEEEEISVLDLARKIEGKVIAFVDSRTHEVRKEVSVPSKVYVKGINSQEGL